MLKKLKSSLQVLLVAASVTSCAWWHDPTRPNRPTTPDIPHKLLIHNGTPGPLALLPSDAHPGESSLMIPSNGSKELEFKVRDEINESESQEHEIVFVAEASSHYIAQSSSDLLLRAKFGNRPAREIRLKTGPCLTKASTPVKTHQLKLLTPPLQGVPAIDLCR